MDYLQKLLIDIECQSLEGIKECFNHGINPNDTFRKKPLIYEVINGYPRGPLFKESIKIFMEHGLQFEDKTLLAVLCDDVITLEKELALRPNDVTKKYTLECTFTPLVDTTLLHICAEYNHLNCAKILVSHGADINASAGIDLNGFGGHSPIFHTVNQHANRSRDMMNYLVSLSADLYYTVKGLIWGQGYEWETFIPSVNPVSYAMMGLLRQFQRTEKDIYEIVSILMKAKYGIDYYPVNIPNAYMSR